MSEQTYEPVNFKHCRSTSPEGTEQWPMRSCALDDQLYWVKKQPTRQDCVAVEVGAWCTRNYLVIPRMQQELQFILPTSCNRFTAVCEHWWDPRTAYPLLTSANFSLIAPYCRPSSALLGAIDLASARITPPILRVRSTQLQHIYQTRSKYFSLLGLVMLLWGILTLLGGVLNTRTVGPVCAGAAIFTLLISVSLAVLSAQARKCYIDISLLLREFCAQHECASGYRLRSIGPLSLVVERSMSVP